MKNIKVLLALLAMLCFSACAADAPTEEDFADEQSEIDSKAQALTTVTGGSYLSGQLNGPPLTTVGQVSELFLTGFSTRSPATTSGNTRHEYRFSGIFSNTPWVGYRVLTPSCGNNAAVAPLKIEFCCRLNGYNGSDAWTCTNVTEQRYNSTLYNDAGWCHGDDQNQNPRWDWGWGYVGRLPNMLGWPEYKYRVQYQAIPNQSYNGQPLNQIIGNCNSSTVQGDIFVPYRDIARN